MTKIYKTFDEYQQEKEVDYCKAEDYWRGRRIFDSRQPEIDQLKERIKDLEKTLEDVTKFNQTFLKNSVDISDIVSSVNTVLNLLK